MQSSSRSHRFAGVVLTGLAASAAMTTKQTSGDCNNGHTEQGTMAAIGRILLATP